MLLYKRAPYYVLIHLFFGFIAAWIPLIGILALTYQVTQYALDIRVFPIEFLVKPFDINDLVNAIEKASRIELKRVNLKKLLKSLSPREKEVFNLLIQGLNNAELMEKINISLPTVKQYKSEVMRKIAQNFELLYRLFCHVLRLRPCQVRHRRLTKLKMHQVPS